MEKCGINLKEIRMRALRRNLTLFMLSVSIVSGLSCQKTPPPSASLDVELSNEPLAEKETVNRWFVSVNNKASGPYTIDELNKLSIAPKTYVLLEGSLEWKPAEEFPEIVVVEQKSSEVIKKEIVPISNRYIYINSDNPGQMISINDYIQNGYINIFDLYSKYCGPCEIIGEKLKKLLDKRKDIVVNKVDIDRPNSNGIDFESPIAKQYGIEYIPHFYIYYPDTKKWITGEEASIEVMTILNKEGV